MRASLAAAIAVALLHGSAPAQGGTLVALGDSFSSGDGAAPYDPATVVPPRPCKRSSFHAWPALVGRALGHEVRHVACSGATAVEITDGLPGDRQPMRRRPQLALLPPNPDMVTLTVGGNDVGFAKVIVFCFAHPACQLRYGDRLDATIRDLEPRLARVYDALRRRVGAARVVITGYPRLFPDDGTPNCGFLWFMSPAEATYLNERTRALNRSIATLAGRAGFEYVPVTDAFDGGELRCGRRRFVNSVPANLLAVGEHKPFHPTASGQRRLAEVVLKQLGR